MPQLFVGMTSRDRFDLGLAAVAGATLGVAAGLTGVAALVAAFGFWAGLMWPMLLGAVAGLWYAARRQRATWPALTFATGMAVGAVPGLWIDAARAQSVVAFELGFAIVLAFLVGLLLAPGYLALRARLRRAGDA